MSVNLGGIDQSTTAALALGNLVLVTPQTTIGYQPQNFASWKKDISQLPPPLVFNYEGEQTASLTSDITDHFTEDNSTIQDQIALKPIIITTSGFVGELNNVPPAALAPIKTIADKLVAIGAYTPALSTTAILAYQEAFLAYQTGKSLINSGVNTWNSITGQGGQSVINSAGLKAEKNQTQQQIYFQQFYGYWNKRALFTIQTPWAIFQDMAIMNLRAIQDAETDEISNFEITFKQLRFASTLAIAGGIASTSDQSNNFQNRLKAQGSNEVDMGTNTLETSPQTFEGAIP